MPKIGLRRKGEIDIYEHGQIPEGFLHARASGYGYPVFCNKSSCSTSSPNYCVTMSSADLSVTRHGESYTGMRTRDTPHEWTI